MKKNYFKTTLLILFLLFSLSMKSIYAEGIATLNSSTNKKIKDFSLASKNNNVYVTWTSETDNYKIYLSKSIDNGNSFAPEKNTEIQGIDSKIEISDDGDLYITFILPGNIDETFNILFFKSSDGGETFSTPVIVSQGDSFYYGPTIKSFEDNVYIFYGDIINFDFYFVKSIDKGENFGAPIKINNNLKNTNPSMTILSFMDIDKDGNIFLTWIDAGRADSYGDLAFAKSIDGGNTFSEPLIVNSTTSSVANEKKYEPKINVDDDGNIFIAYVIKENFDKRIYYSYSLDGGTTFSEETILVNDDIYVLKYDMQVSNDGNLYTLQYNDDNNWGVCLYQSKDRESFSNPITINSYENSGDVGMVINGSVIHTAWIEKDEGKNTLYYKNIDISEFSYTKITKNNTKTTDIQVYVKNNELLLSFSENLKNKNTQIIITDVLGNLIYEQIFIIADEMLNIPLNISNGVYIINLKAGKFSQSIKFIK